MIQLVRGFRGKIEDMLNINQPFQLKMKTIGNAIYDSCCFGVDASDNLSDDRYMVFYNQPISPGREISLTSQGQEHCYTITLPKLPSNIVKLIFTVSIDGNQTMSEIQSHSIYLVQNGVTYAELLLSGRDFHQERAIIGVEIYLKGVWKICVTASGFNGGLPELLKHYGGEIADNGVETNNKPAPPKNNPPLYSSAQIQPAFRNNTPVSATTPKKISLEKKLEKSPELISLAKPIMVQLQKKQLENCVAQVALVMDISGSMRGSYLNGTVQQIVNKILPLAVQFDDDGQLEFWYYGSRCQKMQSVTLDNYKMAVPQNWQTLMRNLLYGNNEPCVMKEVVNLYKTSTIPAYVIFVTDGGISREDEIKDILKEASKLPIFWQFVGVSGGSYGVLNRLDTLKGRYVDNANFFALDDFRVVNNDVLYDRLLNEFPSWLKEIKRLGMI